MNNTRIAIIGSYYDQNDKSKSYEFSKTRELFESTCISFGKQLRTLPNIQLVTTWTNDFLFKQVLHGDYCHENTADFNSLKGILSDDDPSFSHSVNLFISDKMKVIINELLPCFHLNDDVKRILLDYGDDNKKRYNDLLSYVSIPTLEAENTLRELLYEQISEYDGAAILVRLLEKKVKHVFDCDAVRNGRLKYTTIRNNSLRSEILAYDIIPNADIVIFIGGSKAQLFAIRETFLWENKVPIFIPTFKGAVEEFINNYKFKYEANTPRYLEERINEYLRCYRAIEVENNNIQKAILAFLKKYRKEQFLKDIIPILRLLYTIIK